MQLQRDCDFFQRRRQNESSVVVVARLRVAIARSWLITLVIVEDVNVIVVAFYSYHIVDQNFIGSVVIQSFLDGEDDEDSDDDENTGTNFDSSGTIFGITTAVNIAKSQSHGCIEEIRKHLLLKCDQFAQPEDKQAFNNALNDETKQTALLINERFINIPAQIAVPLLENLQKEITQASVKKEKFRFNNYIMIVKFNRRKKSKSKQKDQPEDIFSNGEEEILDEYADASFEYSAERETDSTLSGNWTESDSTLVPHRKVIIFDSTKLPFVIDAIKELISE